MMHGRGARPVCSSGGASVSEETLILGATRLWLQMHTLLEWLLVTTVRTVHYGSRVVLETSDAPPNCEYAPALCLIPYAQDLHQIISPW